ncbi:putative reverse transcriptase domain-containing protein [Tanacetum coccineum]
MKRKAVKKMVKKQIAKAIDEYEKTRANPGNVGGPGPANTGGTVNVQGCSHKTFMNGKPHPFNGMEGVVGLRRWIEKVEQVFEICKCAKEDKVMFASSTLEGHALIWWNGNVYTLGIVNANRDDIEAYNNCFHELDLMYPDLVPTEKKKVERYIRGFPERIKGNITSSKPTTLQDAINMAHELVEQAVQGRPARMSESNKRKCYLLWDVSCYGCGEKGHYKDKCPKGRNHQDEGARARAYVMGSENPQQNPNVVTGTFLVNDHYASILFDSGVEKSFVSTEFTPFIHIVPATLDTSYKVELADGKSRMSNTSDKGTTFGDGAARVGMQLRSSPKVSTSSPLVSPSTIINVPRELYSIDVAATFGVPLTTVGDLQRLINDIDVGKHDELLSELTNEDRMEILEALGSICNSIKVDRNNVDVIDPSKLYLKIYII